MYANGRNFGVIYEIGVGEHDSDVRVQTGSGNTAVSCMRNASGHNYRNRFTDLPSSFIVDVAVGILRSPERISSYLNDYSANFKKKLLPSCGGCLFVGPMFGRTCWTCL